MQVFLSRVSDALWSLPVVSALFAAFFHICRKARFPQRRLLPALARAARGGGGYRALCVNLSAVLGVGNIAGMAAAVAAGGPGAVLWCFLAGLLGSGVQFAESLVCMKLRGKDAGGPMHALRRLGMKRSAALYALGVCLCGLLIGAAIPSSAAAGLALPDAVPGERLAAGAALAGLGALALFGGSARVREMCAYLVPPMVAVYLLILFGVLFCARAQILPAARLILREAFAVRPAAAGAAGFGFSRALHWGCARGLFSSEAGMGTIGIAAGAEEARDPARRAMECACSAVIDTMLLASLTGLTFVAGALHVRCGLSDARELVWAVFSIFPVAGGFFIRLCVTFLAFSTIMGWYWIAGQAFSYLSPQKGRTRFACVWLAAVLLGPAVRGRLLWELCDCMTPLLLAPNLVCVLRALPLCGRELDALDEKPERNRTCT